MPRPRPVIDDTHLLVSGNVVIHPTATIAPDVLLQADPDCQLVVAAGACIGTGSVLHAYQGKLTIESGATLGSGVLVVGHGTIGAEACVGAMSTIIDSSIEANESVPPGSLIGDRSRQVDFSTVDSTSYSTPSNFSTANPAIGSTVNPVVNPTVNPTVNTFVPPASPSTNPAIGSTFKPSVIPPISQVPLPNNPFSDPSERNGAVPSAPPPGVNGAVLPVSPNPVASNPSPASSSAAITPSESPSGKAMAQVYGKAYLERVMGTMFPHRKLFEPPKQLPENTPDSSAE